jgi:hypothetical protein
MKAIAAAAVFVALAVPAVAAGYANFRAPGRTVYCALGDPPPPIVLNCWRARDGLSIAMLPTGRALVSPDRNNRGNHQDRARVLQIGQTWQRKGYRCTSRRNGVTCTNRSGHGWRLGLVRGYKLF